MAQNSGNAPRMITWVLCLVLYLFALAGHFNIAPIPALYATWAWILGFGLLIVATKIKGL